MSSELVSSGSCLPLRLSVSVLRLCLPSGGGLPSGGVCPSGHDKGAIVGMPRFAALLSLKF